jgi:Mor family transcriptional regulator
MRTTSQLKPLPPAVSDDIVDDMFALIFKLAPEFSRAVAAKADEQIRSRWGGDRPYVRRNLGEARNRRNQTIFEQYKRGDSIASLARRWSLTERQIHNVIKEPAPAQEQKTA